MNERPKNKHELVLQSLRRVLIKNKNFILLKEPLWWKLSRMPGSQAVNEFYEEGKEVKGVKDAKCS